MRAIRSVYVVAVSAALCHFAVAVADEPTNVGFEDGRVGHLPPGWFVPVQGWKAELVEGKAAAGARSLKLFKADDSNAPFGNVMHSTPAGEYAGRHVTLAAKVRVEGGGHAQMWLRVDRANKQMGAFDNMGDRPIQPGEWTDASIEADIDADAAALNIGFMALGGATLFIDDVKLKLSDVKTVLQPALPPKALSKQGVDNLVAAARLLSYVRFFHPSDQAVGVASWDHFAVDLMERAESAADAKELAQRLSEAIVGIAPTVQIWVGTIDEGPPPPSEWPTGATQFVQWRHFGAGSIARAGPNQIYRSTVEKEPLANLPASLDVTNIVRDLGAGLYCRLPLVFADKTGTLPHGRTPDAWAAAAKLPKLSALNRSTRLAGVALAWGVFEHFYPYFDVVECNWEAALPAALAKAAEDADELAYLGTLRELVAKLHDGHGGVMNPALMASSLLPLALEWAGRDLVIVGKHAGVPDTVSIGDVIISIDGRSSEDCYREVSKWISAATDGWSRWTSNRMLSVNLPTADPAKLILRKPGGETVTVELSRVPDFTPSTATVKRPDNGAELSPGLLYFNLDAAEPDALTKLLPRLESARGIIFDLRGYPGGAAYQLMQHLIDEPAASARWCIPIIRRPDRERIEWEESGRWPLRPQKPRLTAKIAFLTDGRAISYAESIMGIVEHYKFGEIIGATTAGTNGNVNPFTVPGGYTIAWTGMRVLKHDGTQHHGIGIAPTVPVTPTAGGIAEGRDEVLEKAVEVMREKIGAGA